jgi:hypothetical protein
MDEEATSAAEAQALGELAEDLAEELPGAPAESEGFAARGPSAAAPADEDLVQEADADDAMPRSARESTADVDALPDIDALEPASTERPGRGSLRSPRSVKQGERPEDAVREVLSVEDPATLARALRTVLKKDEKG